MRRSSDPRHPGNRRQRTLAGAPVMVGVLLAVGLVLGAICFSAGSAAAAKSVDMSLPASVQFVPRPGDRIHDDGSGAYADGHGSISCLIHRGASGDLTLHDSSSGNRVGPRRIGYDFSAGPVPTSCQAAGGAVPAAWQAVGVTVKNIDQVAVGTTENHYAVFFLQEGQLQFFYPLNPCTSLVHVHRDSASSWTIQSDGGGLAVFSQAIQGQGVPISYWDMPFQFAVTLQ
jgi:hypothetical protein